jgi:hypothetical protein
VCATNGKFYSLRFGLARRSMALTVFPRHSMTKPELSVIQYMYHEVRNPETARGQKIKLIKHASDKGAPVTVKLMPAAGTGGDLSRIFTCSVTLVPFVTAPATYVTCLHLPLCIGILLTAYCYTTSLRHWFESRRVTSC